MHTVPTILNMWVHATEPWPRQQNKAAALLRAWMHLCNPNRKSALGLDPNKKTASNWPKYNVVWHWHPRTHFVLLRKYIQITPNIHVLTCFKALLCQHNETTETIELYNYIILIDGFVLFWAHLRSHASTYTYGRQHARQDPLMWQRG